MWIRRLGLALFGAAVAGEALAANCFDELLLVAHQYNLSADLPVSRPNREGRTMSPHDLARGEAVLPTERPDRTMSIPVAPQLVAGAEKDPKRDVELGSTKRTHMQALLHAAQAAHAQGDDEKCFEYLSRARAVSPPG